MGEGALLLARPRSGWTDKLPAEVLERLSFAWLFDALQPEVKLSIFAGLATTYCLWYNTNEFGATGIGTCRRCLDSPYQEK